MDLTLQNFELLLHWSYGSQWTDTGLVFGFLLVAWVAFKCLRIKKKPPSVLNKQLSTELLDMAKTAYLPGHAKSVINVVKKMGFDVNMPIPVSGGLTLFLGSCLSGDKKLISYMLHEGGGDVYSRTSDQDSAVYLATFGILNSMTPDVCILEDILRAGGKVNKQNRRGFTPLHRAASNGNMEVIRYLLRHGADRSIPNFAGVFPIDSAINAGNIEAAELLEIDVDTTQLVWDVVDPHTPLRIQLGLQSPHRKLMLQSPHRKLMLQSPHRKLMLQSPHRKVMVQSLPTIKMIAQSPTRNLIAQTPCRGPMIQSSQRSSGKESVSNTRTLSRVLT